MGKLCLKNVIVRILTLQKAHAYFISKIKWEITHLTLKGS